MDPTTLLGIILGFALIVNGIGFAKIGNFIDIPSMVIVIGGALSATLSSYPLGILKDIPKHFAVLIRGNRYNIPKLIEQLVDLGTIARQSGLLALEDKAAEIKDPFFRQSVLMIVDANDPDKVRLVLERELDNMMVRHDQAAGLYEKAASYAPSFGMIGTLIGLINMLKGMNLSAFPYRRPCFPHAPQYPGQILSLLLPVSDPAQRRSLWLPDPGSLSSL